MKRIEGKMPMIKKILITIVGIIIVASSFFTGCIEDTDEDGNGEVITQGILELHITDKPAELDILYANVSISMVQVHKAGAGEVEEEEPDEEENGGEGFTADADGEYEGEVGDLIQFIGLASGGEEPYNWSWDFGDGNTSIEQNPQHDYNASGEYVVNLTVTDNTNATAWDITVAKIGVDEDNNSTAGWFPIVNESQTFDLIALLNVTDLLGTASLSVGKYTQIRLTIDSAVITINNSGEIEEHNLTIPSGSVKLIKVFWVYENETTTLTLDFDIYESVHKTGNNKYVMKPTIKVIQE
jgi:hypothetical protein